MPAAIRLAHRARLAALLALGAFAVHQLRYLASFGGSAELAHQGHGYMADLLPPIAVFSLAALVATLIRGTEGAPPVRVSMARRVPLFAAGLVAVFAGQESLEGMLAAGHPAGFAGVFGHGGWVALPLAILVGFCCALVARLLEGVEVAIARAHRPRPRRRAQMLEGRRSYAAPMLPQISPLAFGLARRPPPAVPA
jgi:hypothetical protein